MYYKKNTISVTIHIILALCLILTGLPINPSEVQAAVNEKKLYMDFLSKEEKRMRNEEFEESEIVAYRLIDLDNDGKKELIYEFWDGGARSVTTVCMIKNGKVEPLYDTDRQYGVYGQVFHKIKGSNKKLVSGGATGAFDYWYDVYEFSGSKVKHLATYHRGCGADGVWRYYKDEKSISKQSFLKFKKKLKKIKMEYI